MYLLLIIQKVITLMQKAQVMFIRNNATYNVSPVLTTQVFHLKTPRLM